MMEIEFSEEKLPVVAKKILSQTKPGDFITFTGVLAAGKTSLIREMLRAMGYAGRVSSPTFVIEHRYPVNYRKITQVIHLDLYRLTTEDVANFDWEEYRRPGCVVLIEWPDRAAAHLPNRIKEVTITVVNDKLRHLRFSESTSN